MLAPAKFTSFPSEIPKQPQKSLTNFIENHEKLPHVTCARATICSICVCIWSTTSSYSNTRSIFVRIWSRRCVICRPNGHFSVSNVCLKILAKEKRRCPQTDVIASLSCVRSVPKQTTTTKNPRFAFFRHLNFYFRLFFKYIRVSHSHSLSHSVCALAWSQRQMFVYTDLKSTLTIHEFLLYLR